MVQAGVGREFVEGAGSPGFGVRSSVDESAYAGGMECAGAHGAGLEGGIEGTAGEAPRLELPRSAAESEELGVGGRVSGGLAFVVGGRYNLFTPDNHGAHGDLASFGCLCSFFEGAAHHYKVFCSGSGGWTGRAQGSIEIVVVFRFKFFGHGADNSSAER